MDGTLLDLHFDNYFWQILVPERYANDRGLSFDQSCAEIYPRFRAQHGHLNWYCLDHWSQDLSLDIVGLKHDHQHLIRPRADAITFLEQLTQSHCQIWLVTNAHPEALRLKLAKTGIDRYFHHIISSHELGLPKENLGFWQRLQQHYPFEPAHSLFIDDSEPVLATAQQFGIGQLLTIQQPDSQQPHRTNLQFPAIGHFTDILPISNILLDKQN